MWKGNDKTQGDVLTEGYAVWNIVGKGAQYYICQIYHLIIPGMQAGTLKEITKEIYRLHDCECVSELQ